MNTLPNLDYREYFNHLMKGRPHSAITDGYSFAMEMTKLFSEGEKGIPMPWPSARNFRVRRQEVTIVSGINGHGKSAWMGQVLLHLARCGEVTCNLSMEMPPARTLMRQCKQATGTGNPTHDYQVRFLDWTRGRLFLSDFNQPMTPDGVLGAVAWSAIERGCTQIVVDSLMKTGINPDDYNAQSKFVTTLCELAKSLDVHIWLVAHGRKKGDELAPMDKFDVSGHANITNMADNVITVFRNKRKERAVAAGKDKVGDKFIEALADCLVRCDKQRHGDWEGSIPLNFHKASGQYVPMNSSACKPMDIITSILDAAEQAA